MKITSLLTLSACLIALAAGMNAASGAVIISNNFDGNDTNDIGGTWTGGIANNAGGSANASTGVITNGGANNASAYITSGTVDVSTASSFTVTWVVSGGTNLGQPAGAGNTLGVWHGGFFFGVTSDTSPIASGFETADFAFGVNLVRGSEPAGWAVVDANNGGSNAYNYSALAGTAPTQISIEDGFTLSITLNSDNTYEVSSTGLSNTSTSTGTLLGTRATYSNLASSLRTYTSIGGGTVSYTVDSATLTTVIPEPNTAALIGLACLGLLLRRRRC